MKYKQENIFSLHCHSDQLWPLSHILSPKVQHWGRSETWGGRQRRSSLKCKRETPQLSHIREDAWSMFSRQLSKGSGCKLLRLACAPMWVACAPCGVVGGGGGGGGGVLPVFLLWLGPQDCLPQLLLLSCQLEVNLLPPLFWISPQWWHDW